jgi:hypothetical protein
MNVTNFYRVFTYSPFKHVKYAFNFCKIQVVNVSYLLIFSDEVGALVFDIGSYTVRAGYAGEDCPKVNVLLELIGYVRAINEKFDSCRISDLEQIGQLLLFG